MDILMKDHPELKEALKYALRHVASLGTRCKSPVRVCAQKLLEFNAVDDGRLESDDDRERRAVRMHQGLDPRRTTTNCADVDAGGDAEPRKAVEPRRPSLNGEEREAEERARTYQQSSASRGRRQVVFAEPVRLDANWVPVIIDKSGEQKAEISEVLSKNILFAGMDDEQRCIIVDAMSLKLFSAEEVIIRQGDMGDFYYILSEGACDISKNGRLVLQARKGMGFGELALLYDSPRAATIVATSMVRAWALDRVTFKQVMIGTTMRKRELYESFLRGVTILSTLTTDEILTIADALQPVSLAEGDVVVREGDPHADRFFIVEEGELKAEIAGVSGEVCARLTRGSYFGERALITDEPRAATVSAVRASRCLAMDRAAFLRLLGPINDILAREMELYARYSSSMHPAARSAAGVGALPIAAR